MVKSGINPIKVYQNNSSSGTGQACPVLPAYFGLAPSTNNVVVAAVTGQKIRVMGWILQSLSNVTPSQYTFLNGSGGAPFTNHYAPLTVNETDKLPIADCGYFETSVGVGLYVTIAAGTGVVGTVFYITYTPD